jgi:hypothetical protein
VEGSPFHVVSSSRRNLYRVYELAAPLAQGDKLDINFNVGYSHGFKDGNERPELAYSGTFFDSTYFPTIGYDNNIEFDDPRRAQSFPTRFRSLRA